MKTTTLLPYFGSNRSCADEPGKLLAGCTWVGVPFMGGGSELAHIPARTIVANDLHRAVINLASALAHRELGPPLIRRLRRLAFDPDTLHAAQLRCRDKAYPWLREISDPPDIGWAEDYFVCAWMGRSAKAGTEDELKGALSVRWDAGGGDSAKRYQSAVASLRDWRRVFARCTFVCMDAFDFLAKVKDEDGIGTYADPPFPGAGQDYKHNAGEGEAEVAWHTRLRDALARFTRARVVLRYYAHPLIEQLYPESQWAWHRPAGGRTQANKSAPEVLIVNRAGGA